MMYHRSNLQGVLHAVLRLCPCLQSPVLKCTIFCSILRSEIHAVGEQGSCCSRAAVQTRGCITIYIIIPAGTPGKDSVQSLLQGIVSTYMMHPTVNYMSAKDVEKDDAR